MKKELPPRYQEILTALRDNPEGLTTGQILNWSKKQRFSELKDTTMISYVVHTLRGKQLVTSTQTPGGIVHRITQAGIDELSGEDNEPQLPVKQYPLSAITNGDPEQSVQPVSVHGMIEELIEDSIPSKEPVDIVDQFDESVAIIRSAIVESLSAPKLKIARKPQKIAVLEKLEPLFSDEIADCLRSIRCDLQQCEGG